MWARVGELLAGMDGLQHLKVDLVADLIQPFSEQLEESLLRPALKVLGPKPKRLVVSWPASGIDVVDALLEIA